MSICLMLDFTVEFGCTAPGHTPSVPRSTSSVHTEDKDSASSRLPPCWKNQEMQSWLDEKPVSHSPHLLG